MDIYNCLAFYNEFKERFPRHELLHIDFCFYQEFGVWLNIRGWGKGRKIKDTWIGSSECPTKEDFEEKVWNELKKRLNQKGGTDD